MGIYIAGKVFQAGTSLRCIKSNGYRFVVVRQGRVGGYLGKAGDDKQKKNQEKGTFHRSCKRKSAPPKGCAYKLLNLYFAVMVYLNPVAEFNMSSMW